MKKERAITLISLVITIIILIILAGISISSLTGNEIFRKASYASREYKNAQNKEKIEIAKLENDIYMYGINDNEQYNFKNSIINALNTKGYNLKATDDDSIIIDKISNLKQMILLEENCNSRYEKKIDVSKYNNFEDLNEKNFIVEIVRLTGARIAIEHPIITKYTKNYNNEIGELTISKCTDNFGDYEQEWCIYNVYLAY